jgi:hypothetical protein
VKRELFLLCLPVCVMGCAPPPAGVGEVPVELIVNSAVWADRPLKVMLGSPSGRCIQLGPGAHATANGVPLVLSERGGSHHAWNMGPGHTPVRELVCDIPAFSLPDAAPLREAPKTAIEIVDGPHRIAGVFDNVFAARTFTVDRAEGSTVHAGETLTVTWSRHPDRHQAEQSYRFHRASVPQTPWQNVKGTRKDDSSFVFTVPAAWAGATEGTVRLDGMPTADVERCEGAARCRAVVGAYPPGFRLTIAP